MTGIYAADGSYNTTSIAIGSPSDAAWNGTDTSASLIFIMKAIYAQGVTP